jgi:cation transport ATPase
LRQAKRSRSTAPSLAGTPDVDQATIIGESTPMRKTSGSVVYAGTINQSGALEVIAERLGRDTSFGKIIEAVERAERSQAPVEKTADRYAGYLVYFRARLRSGHVRAGA